MSALSANKALDRVNNYSLLISLINYNISLPYLRIIIYWRLNLKGCIHWNGFTSIFFK